ncbi:MAG: hypothetical protein IJE80_00990 [Peptococcaceae bacterium]|nr:hypothetical protein [Peptococcaceae bacterium]MBQ3510017.1 hypothetical protein [Peptococcaceae bacterium]
MIIDGKILGDEQCEQAKEVVSKYGVTVVCDEEDEKEKAKADADIVIPASAECDNLREVADDFGIAVVCDDEL